MERLASEGCEAGDYRLSGEGVEHICSMQLYARHRALVCFPDDESIVILLVGEHLDDDPELDVYRSLYRLLELPEPSANARNPHAATKPAKRRSIPTCLIAFEPAQSS